jgi:hypothetical protein
MRRATLAGLMAAALTLPALSACGGSGEPEAPAAECLTPAPEVAEAIAEGANATAITPTGSAAVRAPDRADAYLVAMTFTVAGVDEDQTGVWMVASIEGNPAPIAAVDGFAQEFTDWPDTINGEELAVTEAGADDAKACLG